MQLLSLTPQGSNHTFIFIVDRITGTTLSVGDRAEWLWTCPRNAAGHFVSFHPRLRELKTTFRSQTWTLGNLLIPLTAMEYFVAFGRVDIRKRRALHGTAAECGGAQRRTAAPA